MELYYYQFTRFKKARLYLRFANSRPLSSAFGTFSLRRREKGEFVRPVFLV